MKPSAAPPGAVFAVGLVTALAGCRASPAVVAPAPRPGARTAALLASAVCEQARGVVFPLTTGGELTDLFLQVKQCRAAVRDATLEVAATAFAWLAVDRDFGGFTVREFVHATVHLDLAALGLLEPAAEQVVLTLRFRPETAVRVEPVGALNVEATNWASLLALSLAPSAGKSPEALAKARLRQEAEKTVSTALARPIRVTYDGVHDRLAVESEPVARTAEPSLPRPMRMVRGGFARTERFPSGTGGTVRVSVAAGGRVAILPACTDRVDKMLDADRRADGVTTEGWSIVREDTAVSVPPMGCPWTIVARLEGDLPTTVTLDPKIQPGVARPMRGPRWVSIERVSVSDLAETDALIVALVSDTWSAEVRPRPLRRGTLVDLGVGEPLFVRAYREAYGERTLVAEAEVDVAEAEVNQDVSLVAIGGERLGTVRIAGRTSSGAASLP